jgi:ComF family protein
MIPTNPLYTHCNGGRSNPAAQARCVFSSQSDSLTLDVASSPVSAWRAVVRVLRSPVDTLSCALFPASCCACGNPLLRFSRAPVCDSCWNSLNLETRISCARCGENLGQSWGLAESLNQPNSEPQTCHQCTKAPPPFRRAVAFGTYRTTLRTLIHSLKYDGMLPLADALGKRMAQTILPLQNDTTGGLIVPVPLHAAKRSHRQFNHAELLARAAVRELRTLAPNWNLVLATNLLQRQRATTSQAGLTPHQRRVNVRGAFSAPYPAALQGRNVLLIDDIYTTGATARACTKALLKAGAADVWVATVARAQFEHIARPQLHTSSEENEQDRPDPPMEEDVAFWDTHQGAGPIVH